MKQCFFTSDLHGRVELYGKLFHLVEKERPAAVFLGGDLMPGMLQMAFKGDFILDFLQPALAELYTSMGGEYPEIFVILGNDDGRCEEAAVLKLQQLGLWTYVHNTRVVFNDLTVLGYSFVPPTPFRLKDWEKYDVSRFVDPGCSHPFSGSRTVPVSDYEMKYSTMAEDLKKLACGWDLSHTVMLFHSPPYGGLLDRAALDGKMVDHAPLDVHVGSIAVKRFIEKHQPLLTLHGHVHESSSITGEWRERLGKTWCFNGAHNGPELAVVCFNPCALEKAKRILV